MCDDLAPAEGGDVQTTFRECRDTVEGGITEDGYLFIDSRQDAKATQIL